MTTQDLEQIGKVIDTSLEPIKSDISGLKQGQARLETAIESVKAGQDDIRDHMEAGFMDLGAKIDRTARDNKRLIEELEEQIPITNPHKN